MQPNNEQPQNGQPSDENPPEKKPRAQKKESQPKQKREFKQKPKRKYKRISAKVKRERKIRVAASAKRREQFLELFRIHGKTSVVSNLMGISRHCVNQWCVRVKGFREELEAANEEYCDRLEEEARRRGVDGVESAIYHQGVVVGKERLYSDRLLIKLLEGARPGKYSRKERVVNHTGGYSIDVSGQVTVAVTIQQAVEAMEAKYGEDLETVARSRLGVMLPGLSGAGHDGAAALGAVHGPAARGGNGSNGNGHHQGTNGSNGNGHH